jgi:hypothetical protein
MRRRVRTGTCVNDKRRQRARPRFVAVPVPLEYPIEWLTCAVASSLDAIFQPPVLENACRDQDQRHLAQARRSLEFADRGVDVDPLVRRGLNCPVDPRPGVQPVIDSDFRLA